MFLVWEGSCNDGGIGCSISHGDIGMTSCQAVCLGRWWKVGGWVAVALF